MSAYAAFVHCVSVPPDGRHLRLSPEGEPVVYEGGVVVAEGLRRCAEYAMYMLDFELLEILTGEEVARG